YADDRFEDTAEYARSALELESSSSLRAELLCLRGESLRSAGHPREAASAFEEVVDTAAGSPYLAQALFSGAPARGEAGGPAGARAYRDRLLRDRPLTPWATRLKESSARGRESPPPAAAPQAPRP